MMRWLKLFAVSFSICLTVVFLLIVLPALSAPSFATLVVDNTADSGTGTLRWALLNAQNGDIITFNTSVFTPLSPVTITLFSQLPPITQDGLNIEASSAGVILDGDNVPGDFASALEIFSNGNVIRGLQIINFSGGGIILSGGASSNLIGGDRSIGSGPIGQGNRLSNNGIGIGLWDNGTSSNTISGNLIGTDASGTTPAGNNGDGITISAGASNNIIGRDNVIAYNAQSGGGGITVIGVNSTGNTIFQNSIHSHTANEGKGIILQDELVETPYIFDFNLSTGHVAGTACPNGTVEIFSDNEDEGRVYEGQTTANSSGSFTFDKGAAFVGPHMTATCTNAGGTTSEFSLPTVGISQTLVLQTSNPQPRRVFQTKLASSLIDNRIGDMIGLDLWHFNENPESFANRIEYHGLKWMRVSIDTFDWTEVANGNAGYSSFTIDPIQDQAINELLERDIDVMYTILYWDDLLEMDPGEPRFEDPAEIQRYVDYAEFIATNLGDRITIYEIFNEPGYSPHISSQQNITVGAYINLAQQTIPVIRAADPASLIVVGTVGIDAEWWREYLFTILESDLMPIVDAVSWHPFYGESPEVESEHYYQYPQTVQQIKDTAIANGFDGDFIAEEIQWRTLTNFLEGDPVYSDTVAAKYLARGIVMNLGMGVRVGMAETLEHPQKETVIHTLSTIMAGAEPTDFAIDVQTTATDVVSYTFSLSTGDQMIALWRDGVAQEQDSGTPATVTIYDVTEDDVVGIDVLYGFEQSLITQIDNSDLIIPNLLIKDYPTLIYLNTAQQTYLPIILQQ